MERSSIHLSLQELVQHVLETMGWWIYRYKQ
jgi:hypothetical protein